MSKYYLVSLLFVACPIVGLLGSGQLWGQTADSAAAIVNADTSLVARIGPEALDTLLYRTPESKEATGETVLEKKLRQTKEVLDGQPFWFATDWPRLPTQITISVGDPDGKKVSQLLELWNAKEKSVYAKGLYTVSVQAINDVDFQPDKFADDRWKTSFAETFSSPKSPITFAMLPPKHLYRTYKELSTQLPDYLGGGPATVLTEGALSASGALDLSASLIDGSIESRNTAAAENLKDLFEGARALVLEQLKKSNDDPGTRVLTMVAKETKFSVDQNRVLFHFEHEGAAGSANPIQQAMEAFRGPIAQAVQAERLRNATLAMLNYESAYRHFPPQGEANNTETGKELSWRVHILPFFGEVALYKAFKLDQPWDSPHNIKLLDQMPDIYRASHSELTESVEDAQKGLTTMVAPISDKTILGSPKLTTFADIVDGSSNTIILVVVKDALAVPWTAPQDYKFDPENPSLGLKMYGNKTPVARADGSTQSADKENDWLNLFQMNDGEPVQLE